MGLPIANKVKLRPIHHEAHPPGSFSEDSCQHSFCITFAFLSGEEEGYSWALDPLQFLYQHELPSVVMAGRCLAVINASAICFPLSEALLCLWHVKKVLPT